MIIIVLFAYLVGSTVLTLGFYVWIMRWKKRGMTYRNATPFQKRVFEIGLFGDIIYNYTTLTVVMLQFPRRGEVLATARLKRTITQTGWRANIAKGYCWLLHQFDPGHCT